MNRKEIDKFKETLMLTGDYEKLPDGSVQLKGLKPFSGTSGIRCSDFSCQHDLYLDGFSVCDWCLELERKNTRACHLCGNIMKIL